VFNFIRQAVGGQAARGQAVGGQTARGQTTRGQAVGGQESWIRRFEHLVLRGVSFVFSVGGAYAFGSFFAPLDEGDPIQAAITVSLSAALGLASYFLSRGIADRLMAIFGEESGSTGSVWSIVFFVPLFLVCEFLEVFTNYAKAIPAVHDTVWLQLLPLEQRPFHVFCTYLVYCVVPLVSPCLAVVDMGLERKKLKKGQSQQPVVAPSANQRQSQQQPVWQSQQPVVAPSANQRQSQQQPVWQSQQGRSPMQSLPPKQVPPHQGVVGNPLPGVTRQPSQPEPELEAV
jgi:hypothetical protein